MKSIFISCFILYCVSLAYGVNCTYYDTFGCPCNAANAQFCRIVVPEGTDNNTCVDSPYIGSANVICNDDGTWDALWYQENTECEASGNRISFSGNGTECTPATFGTGSWICDCGDANRLVLSMLVMMVVLVLGVLML